MWTREAARDVSLDVRNEFRLGSSINSLTVKNSQLDSIYRIMTTRRYIDTLLRILGSRRVYGLRGEGKGLKHALLGSVQSINVMSIRPVMNNALFASLSAHTEEAPP